MTDSITVEIDSTTLTAYSWVGSTSSTPLSLEHGIIAGPVLPSVIPEDEVYYWTNAWQQGEQATLAEIDAGKGVEFDNAQDLIRWLYQTD